jgi:hypothetical protein
MTTMLVVPDNGVSRTWISHAGSGPIAWITTLPSPDGSACRSTLEPRSVSSAARRSEAWSADMPSAKVALAGPSRDSVGTASRVNGNDGGSPSQIRPHSVSVWVGGWPAGGGDATDAPPGTGVRLGSVDGLALAGRVGDTDWVQPHADQQAARRIGSRSTRGSARIGDRADRGVTDES